MSKQIEVPKGMLYAVCESWKFTPHTIGERCVEILEAALRWLAENPRVPTDEQAHKLWVLERPEMTEQDHARSIAVEWQRIAFLKPEPKVPEDAQIAAENLYEITLNVRRGEAVDRMAKALDAFRRGVEKGAKR